MTINKPISLIFVLVLCFTFLFGIGDYGLFSKDEPRYAGCALEMIENHNYVVPKFNFQDRFDKPALYYWLIAGAYKTLGVNSFTSRLPSALSAILLVLFTWYTGSKISGKKYGFLSAVILATSIQYIFLGRRAATDITLCLFFSASMYSMYLSYHIKDWKTKMLWTVLSGVFAGLAILTKGPIGIVFQLTVLTLFLIFRKQIDARHLKIYFLISLISLLVSLPWYIGVHNATSGEFTKVFFFTHNLDRFTSIVGDHPGPFWFYIPVILFGFLPWTFFLLPSVLFCIKNLKRKSPNKFVIFCFLWASTVFLFFSASTTKLFTYILLLFPAISFIMAYWILIFVRKNSKLLKKSIVLLFGLLLVSFLVSIYLISNSKLEDFQKEILNLRIIISLMFFTLGIVLSLIYAKKTLSFLISSVFSLVVSGVLILSSALTVYHQIAFGDLVNFAKLARESGAKEIISFGSYKPILVYYGRIPVDFNTKPEQIKKIKKELELNNIVYIIGYKSDIKKTKRLIIENANLFNRLQVIQKGKKYFLGRFI